MKSPVEHIQIPVRYETDPRTTDIDVDYDLVSLSRTAIKARLLAEIDALEQRTHQSA